jgi:prephenate dehydrogenase (NADP+)
MWGVVADLLVVCIQLFRLWLGITEYVYRNEDVLAECLDTAITDDTFRSDDLEFTFAARVSQTSLWVFLPIQVYHIAFHFISLLCSSHPLFVSEQFLWDVLLTFVFFSSPQDWAERVALGHMDAYRDKFERIQTYFAPRFAEATKLGNEMLKTVEEHLEGRKQN